MSEISIRNQCQKSVSGIREGKIREGKITDKGTKSKESDKGTRTMNQSKNSRQGISIRRKSREGNQRH